MFFEFWGVWGSAPDDVYAVGEFGVVLHWGGSSWSPTDAPTSGIIDLSSVWGSGPDDVYTVSNGEFGAIEHWDGSTWTAMSLVDFEGDPHLGFNSIWGSGPNDVWTAGYFGVLHWDGTSWTQVTCDPTELTGPINGIHGTGAKDIWAVTGIHFGGGAGAFHHP